MLKFADAPALTVPAHISVLILKSPYIPFDQPVEAEFTIFVHVTPVWVIEVTVPTATLFHSATVATKVFPDVGA